MGIDLVAYVLRKCSVSQVGEGVLCISESRLDDLYVSAVRACQSVRQIGVHGEIDESIDDHVLRLGGGVGLVGARALQ